MDNKTNDSQIIIIGAGFAGLAAGIYAQMNGYKSQIFEMHNLPGGLCTAWQRKGYTIDCCIHWLVGSSPESSMHDLWEEVGITQGRHFINMDEYYHLEDADGRTLTFYTNVDRLEKHLLEFAPGDAETIREFIRGIRICRNFNRPSVKKPLPERLVKQAKLFLNIMRYGKKFQEWMKITCQDFANRFNDPLLKIAFRDMWIPDFSLFFIFFTFAYLHDKDAGYPLGGSMPMSEALERRYEALGGVIHYNSRVEKVITEGDNAVGIRLDDGTEHLCSKVISAADGYTTIFKMLGGKYTNDNIREMYEKWLLFPPLIYASIGVNRTFTDLPLSVSGFSFPIKEPAVIGEKERNRLYVHIFNHDPSMAPPGKTVIIIMLNTDYEYWRILARDKSVYVQKKEEIANKLIKILEQRFPGITSQVEMVDIATPMTFEKYTGNWKGSFEGWLITPENSKVIMKPMSQSLPGLNNFYMCGQWIEPGGGLPTGIMSGRRLIKRLCKEDHRKFRTTPTT